MAIFLAFNLKYSIFQGKCKLIIIIILSCASTFDIVYPEPQSNCKVTIVTNFCLTTYCLKKSNLSNFSSLPILGKLMQLNHNKLCVTAFDIVLPGPEIEKSP